MARSFKAQVRDFMDLTERNKIYVARQSIQDVLEKAQRTQPGVRQTGGTFERGKIPVETSELVNSLTVGGAKGDDAYVVAIAGYEVGESLRFAWTAEYAMAVELGHTASNGTEVPGRFFVTDAVVQFEQFVERRVAEVKK